MAFAIVLKTEDALASGGDEEIDEEMSELHVGGWWLEGMRKRFR